MTELENSKTKVSVRSETEITQGPEASSGSLAYPAVPVQFSTDRLFAAEKEQSAEEQQEVEKKRAESEPIPPAAPNPQQFESAATPAQYKMPERISVVAPNKVSKPSGLSAPPFQFKADAETPKSEISQSENQKGQADPLGLPNPNGSSNTIQAKMDGESTADAGARSTNITSTVIQRDEPTASGGHLNFPFELGQATINREAAMAMIFFSDMFSSLSREIQEYPNYTGNTSALDRIAGELLTTARTFSSRELEAPIAPAEAFLIQPFIDGYQETYTTELGGLKNHIVRNIDRVDAGREIPEMTPELAEAQRVAFEAGNTSELERLANIVSAIKDYNGKVNTWIGRVSAVSSAVRNSRVLQGISSAAEGLSDYADKVGQVISAMRTVDTLVTGGNGSETQQSLNQFQAGLDAIDLGMSFVKCVPVLGSLWSNYYYPAATMCIRLLGRIAQERDRNQRLLTWITNNWHSATPPRLNSGVGISFMGGEVVFSFMWRVFFDNYTYSAGAENFFMEHKDQFNATCSVKMTITGEWNPFEDNHISDFEFWASHNKNSIWTSLYGADLPYPGSNTRPGD